MRLTPDQVNKVAQRLGREPRGLEEIAVADAEGNPVVIRVASLVDDKPFPTLFWLIDPGLCYRIDQLEAQGLIARFQSRIDADASLRQSLRGDHEAYIALRDRFIPSSTRQRLTALGFGSVLADKGVGGIADFSRIRCLHTWYGAHLVVANTVGRMLDAWWNSQSPQ
jgi:hypothetical protein